MSEFWIEQTEGPVGPWDDGGWAVWHRPDGVEEGSIDDYEVVAICETETVAEATLVGLAARLSPNQEREGGKNGSQLP